MSLCRRQTVSFLLLALLCAAPTLADKWTHLSTANSDLPAPNSGDEQTACLILDIDGDSITDFVIAERTAAPALTWFRRSGSTWDRYIIEANSLPIEAGGAVHDFDGDGDPDIVLGGDASSCEMWWWQNPRPDFDPNTPWPRRIIKSSGGKKHHDQAVGDIDNDGRPELVIWNQGLVIIEIPEDPVAWLGEWPRTPLVTEPGMTEGLAIADIDLDGLPDIVGGAAWYPNLAAGNFEKHVIDGDPDRHITRAAVGQLIPGERPEVVLSPGDSEGPLILYEWDGADWTRHTILDHVCYGHSLQVLDIDRDSHLDLFVAEMGSPGASDQARTIIFYGRGSTDFVPQLISTCIANHESKVADLDGDGDFDIITKPYHYGAPRLDIWLNNDCLVNAQYLAPFAEYWLANCPTPESCDKANLDGDTTVTLADLAIFAQVWLTSAAPPADLNHDCAVTFEDFPILLNRWLRTDCSPPSNCAGADLTHDGQVNLSDYSNLTSALSTNNTP